MNRIALIAVFLLGLCLPASSQFNGCPAGFCSPKVSGAASAILTYENFQQEILGTGTSTYTATFGPTGANQVVVVAVGSRGTATGITSVVIGGVTATLVPSSAIFFGSLVTSGIYYATGVPTTSGTVTVVWAGNPSATGIQVYNVTTTTPAPSSGTSAGSSTTSVSNTLTVPSNGIGISTIFQQGTTTIVFTNATVDNVGGITGGRSFTAAHTSGSGSITITGTVSGALNQAMSSASWGP